MSLAERATAQQGTRTAVSFGRGFVDDTGNRVNSLSSIEMLKHYTELGLETNFVRTSLGAVQELAPTVSRKLGDPIKVANSYGEDARRLSLFADGLGKAEKAGIKNFDEALNYAADHTRKYLFDYTDFSNFERNTLGRIVPFYKWTRKAVPLLTEMLFFKPGKIAMTPKFVSAINTANGAPPPDGENYPWMATADAIIPSWMRLRPMVYMGDNTGPEGEEYGTYAIPPDPFSDVFSRMVDPLVPGGETIDPTAGPQQIGQKYLQGVGAMAMSQVAPPMRVLPEFATGEQAFGSNELGGRPIEGTNRYFTGLFPQISKTQDLMAGGEFNDLSSILGFLGAANVQENDSNKQMSEIMFLKQILYPAVKKAEEERLKRTYGSDYNTGG